MSNYIRKTPQKTKNADKNWSKEEDYFLKDEYYENSIDDVVQAFRRQYTKIISNLQTSGVFISHKWTEEDCLFLKKHYPDKDIKLIANSIGKTCSACINKANKLKLKRLRLNEYGYPRAWSEAEDTFLIEYYEEKGAQWVSTQIGRTVSACQHRASRIKVRKQKRFAKWTNE